MTTGSLTQRRPIRRRPRVRQRLPVRIRIALSSLGLVVVFLICILFVAPIRNRFFATSTWPWTLPHEISRKQMNQVAALAEPGDVIVESNMHFAQWVGLSYVFTGSTWVHASLVDDRKHLITETGKVVELPINIYGTWRSTRVALVRPKYSNRRQIASAIAYAKSKEDTPYDPSFENPNASCTGLVADALGAAGIAVPYRTIFGRRVYPADSFFKIDDAKVLWCNSQLK